jgi:predicted sulfurtransferase
MKHHWLIALKADLITAWLFATGALCVGLVINQFRDHPLALVYQTKVERLHEAVTTLAVETPPAPVGQSQAIALADFRAFVQTRKGLVLDARPEIFHRMGHVPGAISVSREAFKTDYEARRSILEPHKNDPIAVYCSSTSCEDSQMVADALLKLGYQRVLVFTGGWAEWNQQGLPEEHL